MSRCRLTFQGTGLEIGEERPKTCMKSFFYKETGWMKLTPGQYEESLLSFLVDWTDGRTDMELRV